MQEDFLHYIWQYQKVSTTDLVTVSGETVQVLSVGEHNTNSGPDFYNAKLRINGQVWVGTVELHLKSSDWYVHQHHLDKAYNNVILHVVWDDDVEVFDVCQNQLQTLQLQHYVDEKLLQGYKALLLKKNWINCENQIHLLDSFTIKFWKEKLLIKRLERKSLKLQQQLQLLENDWEALLFYGLAESFGLKLNSEGFLQTVRSITFKRFKKECSELLSLEALLFGQANLLIDDVEDEYIVQLKTQFNYLKRKYQLEDSLVLLQFFRMRPSGFPTLRLSQFAALYNLHQNLFMKVIELTSLKNLRKLLAVSASEYWDTHYTFGKISSKRKKTLSKSFVDVLLINVIIPIRFLYAKSQGVDNFEELLKLYVAIPPEKNNISTGFQKLKIAVESTADSQALIELKTRYCNQYKCLQCEIGNKLLYKL